MADCRSQFLSDDPTSEDYFGSREPLAEMLADIIEHTPGGKTVGLIGAWGSGKSSVITALREKLAVRRDPGKDYRLVTFDAWSHEGDPLRRVFLERLERDLMAIDWVDEPSVADTLACRTSLSMQEEGIRLSWGGGFVLAALFLSTTMFAFLGLIRPVASVSALYLGAAVFTLLLTPAVVIGVLLAARSGGRADGSDDTSQTNGEKRDILGLLMSKPRTVAKTETRSIPDPTSVDFEDLFQGLLRGALGCENRHLVMVIDNLDRIDSQDAMTVWSTMRTFLDSQRVSNEPHLRRMWLIVPFAKDSITHLDSGAAMTRAAAYDKIFDLVLEVPPPISSKWREYFFEQLGKALPLHEDSPDVHTIYRLYGAFDREDWPLTPRAAKRFINKLVAVHHLWVHDIPLVSQALYVLLNGRNSELASNAELPRGVSYLAGDEWPTHYAALTYGLDPELALQAVVGPRIAKALEAGDADALRDMRLLPGFAALLESVLEQSIEDWEAAKPLTAFVAAAAIESVELDAKDHAVAAIWRRLTTFAVSVGNWDGLTEDIVRGVASVIRMSADRVDVAEKMAHAFSNMSMDEIGAEKWYAATHRLVEELGDQSDAVERVLNTIHVPGDGQQYLSVLAQVADDPKSELSHSLRPQATLLEVTKAVIEVVAEEPLASTRETALLALVEAVPDLDWQQIAGALGQRFEGTEPISGDTMLALANVLRVVGSLGVNTTDAALADVIRSGALSMRWMEAYAREEYLAAGAVLACQLGVLARTLPFDEVGWSGNSRAIWDGLVADGEEELRDGLLPHVLLDGDWLVDLLTASEPGLAGIAAVLLRQLLKQGSAILELLNWEDVLGSYDAIVELAPNRRLAAEYLFGVAGSVAIMEHGYKAMLEPFYCDALNEGLTDPVFDHFLIVGLAAHPASVWQSALSKPTYAYILLMHFHGRGVKGEFGEPLATSITTLLRDDGMPTELVTRLRIARLMLSDEQRSAVDRGLLEDLIAADVQQKRAILGTWGEELSSSDVFTADAVRFLDEVARPLVEAGGVAEHVWILDVIDRYPAILQSASARAKRDLKNRIKWKVGLKRTAQASKKALSSVRSQLA